MTQATETKKRDAIASSGAAGQPMVVVRLGEVTLKKGNRPYFVRQVGRNIRKAAGGLDVRDVEWSSNRVLVRPGPALDWPELRERLRHVFGIANFSLCEALPWDIDAIREGCWRSRAERPFESFRIDREAERQALPGDIEGA